MQLNQAGKITDHTMLDILQAGEILPDDLDIDAELTNLAQGLQETPESHTTALPTEPASTVSPAT